MVKVIVAIALTFNAVLAALLSLVLLLRTKEITVKYFVTALAFTIVNIIALTSH